MERSVLPTRVDRKAVEPAKAAEKPPSVRQVKPLKSEAEEKKVEAKTEEKKVEARREEKKVEVKEEKKVEKKAEKAKVKEETKHTIAEKITEENAEEFDELVGELDKLRDNSLVTNIVVDATAVVGLGILGVAGVLELTGASAGAASLFLSGAGILVISLAFSRISFFLTQRRLKRDFNNFRKKLYDTFGFEEGEEKNENPKQKQPN